MFGSRNDGFPDKIKVRGIIREVSSAAPYCGTIQFSGTIRVELSDKIKKYPQNTVFILVPCFPDPGDEAKYLNRVVELEVHKLQSDYNKYQKKTPCYFEVISNDLNSMGVPFYCTRESREGLLSTGKVAPSK